MHPPTALSSLASSRASVDALSEAGRSDLHEYAIRNLECRHAQARACRAEKRCRHGEYRASPNDIGTGPQGRLTDLMECDSYHECRATLKAGSNIMGTGATSGAGTMHRALAPSHLTALSSCLSCCRNASLSRLTYSAALASCFTLTSQHLPT